MNEDFFDILRTGDVIVISFSDITLVGFCMRVFD